MNGATEATLAELLAEAKAMSVNLVTLNRLVSTGGGSLGQASQNASTQVRNMGTSAADAGQKLNILATAGSLVSGVFNTIGGLIGTLIGGLTGAIKGLYNFSLKAAEGTANLSDFYDSFRSLPLGIGTLMGVLADFQRQNEKLLATYRDITASGASFGGQLEAVRSTATRASLTLDEFSRVVRNNSETFGMMGGNVDRGMAKFTDVQQRLLSRFSNQLLGLGMTAENTANMIAIYMANSGRLDRQELQNGDAMAESVARMSFQMDAYSKITGKSREFLEAELKKKSFDAAWRTFTQGLSPEQSQSALQAIEYAIQTGGEGAGDALKQMFMTGGTVSTPITEASQQFYIQTQGMAEEFVRTMYQSVINLQSGSREQLAAQQNAAARIGQAYNSFVGELGTTGAILALQNNRNIINSNLANNALTNAQRTQKERDKILDEVFAAQAAQGNGTAKSAAEAQLAIRNFGLTLNTIINGALAPFMQTAQEFSSSFLNFLIPTANSMAKWLGEQLSAIKKAYGEGGFPAAFEQILRSLGNGVDNIIKEFTPTWEKVKPQILGAIEKTWDFVKPYLVKAFDGLIDFIKPYFERGINMLFDMMSGYLFFNTKGMIGKDSNVAAMERAGQDQARIMEDYLKKKEAGTSTTTDEIAYATAQDRRKQILAMIQAYSALNFDQKKEWKMPELRHSGTIGMTGNWWEKESATLNIQAGESVVTQDQMRQIVDTASQSGLSDAINRLNNSTVELIRATKQVASNTAENVTATKALSGNLWAT
jgi:hypothetical protein